MMRKTGGTAKTSVEMSCRRVGLSRGSVGEDTGSHGGAAESRRPKVVITRGCPTTRPSGSPMSRIAPGGKDFLQAYNCQAVVDSAHQVIVAARATNQASDKQQAAAMMEETITTSVQSPGKYRRCWLLLAKVYALGPFVRTDPPRPGATRAPRSHTQPSVSQGPDATEVTDQAGWALRFAEQTVEPVFGQIKQGRGFRQFLLRGLEKVNGEWSLICTGHNLLKPFRWGQSAQESTGRWAWNFAEVVIAKLSGGRLNRQN